jgi:nucleoside-diphosphate-sugar epimerase
VNLLILGSNGYIGKHFVASPHKKMFDSIFAPSKSEVDLLDLVQLAKYLEATEFDIIMNCTGYLPHRHEKHYGYEINRFGSANLVKALKIIDKTAPVIHFSSSTEIRIGSQTESEYSASKIEGFENLLKANVGINKPIIQVVLHNVIGKDAGSTNLLNQLIMSAKQELSINIKFPNRIRDFVWIDDCIGGIAEVLRNVQSQCEDLSLPVLSRYEIGSGIPISIYECAVLVYKSRGVSLDYIKVDGLDVDPFPSIVANVAAKGTIVCQTSLESILQNIIEQGDV